jgi:hypothetical protein
MWTPAAARRRHPRSVLRVVTHRTEFPSHEVVADKAVTSAGQSPAVYEVEQFIQPEVGQLKSMRMILRNQEIADLSSFVHND